MRYVMSDDSTQPEELLNTLKIPNYTFDLCQYLLPLPVPV